MVILFCTNSLGAFGGIERATIVKANALADIQDVSVHVCYTDQGSFPNNTIHPISSKVVTHDLGITFWDLYPLNVRNLLLVAPKKFVCLRKSLKRLIKAVSPDVVISTGSYEKYALASIKLPKCAVKIREYHFNSDYRRYLGRSVLFSVAEFFEYNILGRAFDMNYLLTKEDYAKHFSGKSNFWYQGNPCPFTVDLSDDIKRENYVVTVCRLASGKNIAALLRIWQRIAPAHPDWSLLIVGEGPERKPLEEMALVLGIAHRVRFLGFRNDVYDVLKVCRIMALTSKYEGFGLTLIEAMSAGVVPISYRTPYGPADIINDGADGVLVDYMHEEQFADKLSALIDSPQRLSEMSKNAILRSQDFSPANIALQWMTNYNNLLSKKRIR